MSATLNPLQVQILRYNNVIQLSKVVIPSALYRIARTIAKDILNQHNVRAFMNLPVFPQLLEQYNIRYTEKWVKRIDDNFIDYYYGQKPPLNIPRPTRPLLTRFSYIHDKFFSGDVSGMIAESIFIYLLDQLGVNINLIGHLRPLKQRNAYQPDYVVYDNSSAVRNLIQNPKFNPPLYAEVKGCTRGVDSNKICKAFTQLNNVIRNNTNSGLAFIVFKNPQGVSYTGTIIEVTY